MLRFLILASSQAPAEASLAAAGVRRHHPEAEIVWLLCDPRPTEAPFATAGEQIRYAHTVSISDLRATDLLLGMSPAAMRWAVLPAVVAELLGDGGTVVALAATSGLHGPLDELISQAQDGTLLLPARFDRSSAGVAGGWLADFGIFGPRSAALVEWWTREARQWVLREEIDEDDRLCPWRSFLGQAPGLAAGSDGRFRLHPAAVSELRLDVSADDPTRCLIDGRPLVLAHYPEFDPDHPWRYGEVSVSETPGLRLLLHRRADALRAAGWVPRPDRDLPLPQWRCGPSLATEYRLALARAAAGEAERPANPYVAGEVRGFLDWASAAGEHSATAMSRVADDVWARRDDLAHVFPSVRWRDRLGFERWMWTSGLAEGVTNLAVLPDPPRPRPLPPSEPPELDFGVNLIGYHGSEAGLGVAVRRVALALDAAGIPWTEVSYDRTDSRQRGHKSRSTRAPYRFNLILITAEQLPLFVDDVGRELMEGRYNIGLWYWETDVMPESHRGSFELVDEVWGATTYLRDVFAAHTDKPVVHMPIPLVFPAIPDRSTARARLGFDERFTVLFSFDFLSISRRKNPLGLLDAFHRAFPDGSARLIIKSINGERRLDEREELADAVGGVPGAELWDRYLDGDDRLALVAAADCYMSLHRSEGLGLTIAEAMAAGTPVIATDYSGTTDLTSGGAALPVDGPTVEIGPGHYYPAEGHWADPDVEQAAEQLRNLAADSDLRRRLTEAGHRSVARFDAGRVGDAMLRHLKAIAVS
ncbi:MAG: glycosyltransferase family 4 protein [Microthrixaceae bacterium]|nr:glycosyltransferase family 4 protein [Microthrixaceae bacterium]